MLPFYVTGPTGSGKSAVAMELADLLNGELVNADAFQIYRELSIITARPTAEDERRMPHHLYGELSTSETCNAGRWLEMIRPVLDGISSAGKCPVIVGGTGLYIKALTHGLDESPAATPDLRQMLDARSIDEIREHLLELDPESIARIEPGNRRYLQRALEITLTTGQPASSLRKAWESDPPGLRGVFLHRERSSLVDRIHQRVDVMLQSGAVEEVAAVAAWSSTSERAIGVPEIQRYLAGVISLDGCRENICLSTRRYAKRQTTWFRRESWLKQIEIDEMETPSETARRIVTLFPELTANA